MKTFFFALAGAAISIFLTPLVLFACACCAEPGHYSVRNVRPGAAEFELLRGLSFVTAKIYLTEAGRDRVKGLGTQSEQFGVRAEIRRNGLELLFTDESGKPGSLSLKIPGTMREFKADIHDGKKSEGGGPLLYKEWRFEDKISGGTGFFEPGLKGKIGYSLILQGRGNVCSSAEDFSNWRLEVTGKQSSYAFYGELRNDAENESRQKVREKLPKSSLSRIEVSNLTKDYSGCGCAGITLKEAEKPDHRKLFFWSGNAVIGETGNLYLNIGGNDTAMKLLSQTPRPASIAPGDRFTDEYINDGLRVLIDYIALKPACEMCNVTNYDAVATIIGEYSAKVVTLKASCGCRPTLDTSGSKTHD